MRLANIIAVLGLLLSTQFSTQLAAKSVTGAIDAKTFKQLTKAQNLVADSEYGEALDVLGRLRERKSLGGYAKAQVWNYTGYVYATQGDFTKAIDAYQHVLNQEDVPTALRVNARYILGQLYFQTEQYQQSIDNLLLWLKTVTSPSSTAYVLVAQGYYQLSDHDEALSHLNNALELQQSNDKSIPEPWLQLKASLLFSKQDFAGTADVYEILMREYPKVQYLKQLAGLYGELGLTKKRLVTFDAAYEHGVLEKGNEQLNLAYMFIEQDMPFKAGVILERALNKGDLERGIKNQTLLANIWSQAGQHDKAISAYKDAAALSDDGELYAKLAGVYYQDGKYQACVDASRAAVEKGGVTLPGQNFMLLGLSLVNLEKYEAALQAFRQAKDYGKSFKAAKEWEKYLLSLL